MILRREIAGSRERLAQLFVFIEIETSDIKS